MRSRMAPRASRQSTYFFCFGCLTKLFISPAQIDHRMEIRWRNTYSFPSTDEIAPKGCWFHQESNHVLKDDALDKLQTLGECMGIKELKECETISTATTPLWTAFRWRIPEAVDLAMQWCPTHIFVLAECVTWRPGDMEHSKSMKMGFLMCSKFLKCWVFVSATMCPV